MKTDEFIEQVLLHVDSNDKAHKSKNFNLPVVPSTHTGVQPFAMVIKVFHTLVANTTVFYFGATARRFNVLHHYTLLKKTFFLICDRVPANLKMQMNIRDCCSGYIHIHITKITVQVVDNMRLLCSVKERHRRGIALLGPHAVICWIYSENCDVCK